MLRFVMPARGDHRRPTQRWTWLNSLLAMMVAALLAMTGLSASPAVAAAPAAGDITKALDSTQGAGFTAPDTFESGALVRYSIHLACSSNTQDCGVGKLVDVLDSRLTPVDVILPTTSLPLSKSISGQTVTVTVGTAAQPWPDSNTLEVIIVARVKPGVSGTIPNQASIAVLTGTADENTTQSEIVPITVPGPTPQWGLKKSGSTSTISPDEVVKFTIGFTVPSTLGNVPITGGTLIDTFPAGAIILNGTTPIADGGTTTGGGVVDYTAHTITWTVPALDPTQANCSSNPCANTSWSPGVVSMKFPASAFSAGQTVTNNVEANVTYANGDTDTLNAHADVTIVGGTTAGTISKSGPATATPGQVLDYAIRATNTGNKTETNWTVIDTLPAGLTNLQLVHVYGPVWNNSTGVPDSVVHYAWSADGTTYTDFFTYNPGDNWTTPVSIPAGAQYVRMIVDSAAPGAWLDLNLKATVPTDAVADTVLRNCADLQPVNQQFCVNTTITTPQTQIKLYKGGIYPDGAVSSIRPGDEMDFFLNVTRKGGDPLTKIDFVDVLPKGFEFVATKCFYASQVGYDVGGENASPKNWFSPCDTAQTASLTPQQTVNPDGTTTLKWLGVVPPQEVQTGTWYYGVWFTVRALPGTSVAGYTNKYFADNPDTKTVCVANPVADTQDWNANQATDDTFCESDFTVQVREAAIAEVYKWVKGDLGINAKESTGLPSGDCPNLDGYTRYPCVAEVSRSGTFDYLFQHQNTGNVELTDFTMYDILPHVGDTGVNEVLANSPRNTDWTPVLTGPVVIDPATVPAGANPVILYNLSYDPCRPELSQGTPGTNWQGAACDSPEGGTNVQNTWYTEAQITDWSTVKSFKISMFDGVTDFTQAWAPGVRIDAHAPMQAPTTAAESTLSPLDLSVAWNSIAHQESRLNVGGTTSPLLAAAPRKVGIIVPFPGVSVGDYVWLDANHNGLQDPGEQPIADVTVNLYNAAGEKIATTTTDANGYYSFRYLLPSTEFTVEFVAPTGLSFTTTDASGVTSNDPVADNGTTALDGTTGGDSDAVASDDGTVGRVTFTTPAKDGTLNNASDPTAGTVADNPGIDAGFYDASAPKLVSVGDYVWLDVNRDGLQSPDEPAIPGVTVQLWKNGAKVDETTTDATGYYSFVGLDVSTEYTVTFVAPNGQHFTTPNAGGVTSNDPVKDNGTTPLDGTTGGDSDAIPAADGLTGSVTFTTPASGGNQPSSVDAGTIADNPGLDAGFVAYNLTLTKTLTTAAPLVSGGTVTFTLTPHNDGPTAALTGWSVTEVMPSQLTLVSMDGGAAYDCSTLPTCVAKDALAVGVDGAPITVTATINAGFVGTAHNVAYVSPSKDDVDESNPLEVPTTDTNTDGTPTDNDAQASLSGTPVSIGDYVWFDTNRDGQQGLGEAPVAGVTVNLYDAAGGFVASATTNAFGFYSFTDLAAGSQYTVEFVKPANTVFTSANLGADGSDSDADVSTGRVVVTTPVSGSNSALMPDDPTIDAGLVKLVSVGDYMWFDTNRDGAQSAGEAPVSGVTVNLYDAAGGLVSSTVTDANGFYSFTDLLAGAGYTVEFVKPANTVFTVANNAGDAVDSDADVVTGKVAFTAPADGMNSATSPDDPTIDAGLVQLVSLGDYVWFDTNRDGLQSAGEAPVPGVTVNVYDAAGGLVSSTVTDANGFYSFTDLIGGATYTVEFVKPASTVFTTQDAGDDALDSDADLSSGKVTVTVPVSGSNSATTPDLPTVDAGLVKLVSVGDYVWMDANRDGLQTAGEAPVPGVTVKLYDASGALVGETTTDANGFYSFTDLFAGTDYSIWFVKPADAVFTAQTAGDVALDSNADQATGLAQFTTPIDGLNSATTPDDPTIDAGLIELVSVGDYVWYDVNRDGLQTAGEPSVPGVTVNLYDAAGALVGTTTTDGNGFYSFNNLLAGASYTIEFIKPDGTSFTTTTTGTADGSDAAQADGRVAITAPATGANSLTTPDDPTFDAGLLRYNLTLVKKLVTSGSVHPGDTVTFTLTPHNDGPVDALAGWSVTEVMPSGLTLVSMSGDGYDCSGDTCVASSALPAGANGAAITVTAKVGSGTGSLHNVAYVSPSGDDVPETNPLDVPGTDTDTDGTPTDNDAQAVVKVTDEVLPQTGTQADLALAGLAGGLLLAGGGILLMRRRRANR